MNRFLAIFLCCLSILSCLHPNLSAQQRGNRKWDNILDRYEQLCDECISLKFKAESGEKIVAREFSKLVLSLSSIREELRRGNGQMSTSQRLRFDSIRRRYESAFPPSGSAAAAVPPSATPVSTPNKQSPVTSSGSASVPDLRERESVSRDSSDTKSRRPVYESDVLLTKASSVGISGVPILLERPAGVTFLQTRPIVPHKSDRACFAYGSAAVSFLPVNSFGLSAGVISEKTGLGVYAKFLSNFKSVSTLYECLSDGSYSDGIIWTRGKEKKSALRFSGGVQKVLGTKGLRAYAGLGYGSFVTAWEDYAGAWIKVSDLSANGIVAEAGAIQPFGPLELGIGISTTAFRAISLDFTLGFRF